MTISLYLKSAEVKLMETLNAMDSPYGWQAVHFHLSELLEQYKSEYQVRIAVNLINDLLRDHEGGLYLFSDQGIIVMGRQLDRVLLNKLIFQLRYLYMDDPLAYSDDGNENPHFCTSYDLSRDWQAFYDLASRRMAMAVRKVMPARMPPKAPDPDIMEQSTSLSSLMQPASRGPVISVPKPQIISLSAQRLANIEKDLSKADLAKVIRRQPVCAINTQVPVRRVFDELYIHIAHLRQVMQSEVDFLSNRWLFKYLTQLLDARMIELLRSTPSLYNESPVSLNLNVETLLSSAFSEFDAAITPQVKVGMVIEIPVVDVFADMSAFKMACKEVQKQGYRVCLDGVTEDCFLNLNREKIGADLIKMQWNADLASEINDPDNRILREAVKACGTNRIILCRCDNRQAVDYGQALGISLFQGRYIDSMVSPASAVKN